MERSRKALIAIVLSVLLIAAAPASSANTDGQLVVESQHSTDTDFNDAQTLTNLTVSGSGEEATVTLDKTAKYSVVDDSGDGNAESDRHFVGDSGGGEIMNVELKTVPQYSGEVNEIEMNVPSVAGSDYGFTVDVYAVKENPDGTVGEGTLVKSNWDPDFSTGTKTLGLDSSVSVDSGENVTWEFVASGSDGDSTADHLRIGTDEDSGLTNWYWGSGAGSLEAGSDLALNIERDISTAQYISAVHNVSNPEEAAINITQASNVSVEATVQTDGGTTLGTDTYASPGNKSLALSSTSSDQVETILDVSVTGDNPAFELSDESILFTNQAPNIDNSSASPSGGEFVNSTPVNLSIDIDDSQFGTAQGETVNVTFYDASDDSTIGTDTLNSPGTATADWDGVLGENQWYVVAEDEYGGVNQSDTFTFETPSELHIYNETSPSDYVNSNSTVTVQFYADDTVIERTTSDGVVDLSGLPSDQRLIVRADADGFHDRRILIDSLAEQQEIFLLSESVDSVENRFTLEDHSGNFDEDTSFLYVEKPITRNNETNYQVIVADEFGARGVTATFEKDARYRLAIENENGDRREYGSWTASVAETVPITIGDIVFDDLEGEDDYRWGADYRDDGSILYHFNDPRDLTTSVSVTIHERGNESNIIYDETHTDTFGNLSITQPLNETEQNQTWVVDWTVIRDGEEISGSDVVGKNIQDTYPGLGSLWKGVAAVIVMIVLGGSLGAVNPGAGTVSVSLVGAIFYYIGWLPTAVGAIMVLVALMFGVLFTVRRR